MNLSQKGFLWFNYSIAYGYQFSLAWGCFLQGGGLPWRTMCFSKVSRMATAICWTWGSVCSCSLMLYKCCNPPSSINMLQYLEAERKQEKELLLKHLKITLHTHKIITFHLNFSSFVIDHSHMLQMDVYFCNDVMCTLQVPTYK